MEQDTILLYMASQHIVLEDLIIKFKEDFINGNSKASASLGELKQIMSRHYYIEENAIFRFCKPIGSDFCKIVQGLIKQHSLTTEMLDKIEDGLEMKDIGKVDKFHSLMASHRNLEEKTVYPKMDQDFGEMEKQMIINRIKELPLK